MIYRSSLIESSDKGHGYYGDSGWDLWSLQGLQRLIHLFIFKILSLFKTHKFPFHWLDFSLLVRDIYDHFVGEITKEMGDKD